MIVTLPTASTVGLDPSLSKAKVFEMTETPGLLEILKHSGFSVTPPLVMVIAAPAVASPQATDSAGS